VQVFVCDDKLVEHECGSYRTLQRENRLLPLERTVMKEVRKGKSSELLSSCTIRHDEYGLARERCSSALQEVFFG